MKFVTALTVMTSMSTMFIMHPISMMMLVLIQSLLIALIMFISHPNPWVSLILFLIFAGGLMILFVYVTSLASNEKFKIKMINNMALTFILFTTTLIMIVMKKTLNMTVVSSLHMSLSSIFSLSSMLTVASIMVYLFLIMVVVTAIATPTKSPIRPSTWSYAKHSEM